MKDKVEEAPAKESADEKDVKKSEDKEKNKPRSVKEKKVIELLLIAHTCRHRSQEARQPCLLFPNYTVG